MKINLDILDKINQELYEDAIQQTIAEKYGETKCVTNIKLLDLPLPYISYENWGKKVKE